MLDAKKMIWFFAFFFSSTGLALVDFKEKPTADCVFLGHFLTLEEVKINGRSTRPVSTAVGTFRSIRILKGEIETCRVLKKSEFEVFFSSGKTSVAIATAETCDMPVKLGKSELYKIQISVDEMGAYVPAFCHGWISIESSKEK